VGVVRGHSRGGLGWDLVEERAEAENQEDEMGSGEKKVENGLGKAKGQKSDLLGSLLASFRRPRKNQISR
jgi:hypothetical protein